MTSKAPETIEVSLHRGPDHPPLGCTIVRLEDGTHVITTGSGLNIPDTEEKGPVGEIFSYLTSMLLSVNRDRDDHPAHGLN